MPIYVYDRHHARCESNAATAKIAIERAAIDLSENYASPVMVLDDNRDVIMDSDQLLDAAWDHIEENDL